MSETSNVVENEDGFVVFRCDTNEDIVLDTHKELKDFIHNVIVTDASGNMSALGNGTKSVIY